MTETTTEEQAQGAENSTQQTIQSNWKLIEKRTITEVIGVKPHTLTDQPKEVEAEVVELTEAMEIPNIGVVVKTVVYDGYLPSVSKAFIPGSFIKELEDGKFVITG